MVLCILFSSFYFYKCVCVVSLLVSSQNYNCNYNYNLTLLTLRDLEVGVEHELRPGKVKIRVESDHKTDISFEGFFMICFIFE